MILHPTFASLERFVRGAERSERRRRRVAAHLAACSICREQVTWISAVRERLAASEEPPPPNLWHRIRTTLREEGGIVLPHPSEGRRTHRARRPLLAAAAIAIVILTLFVLPRRELEAVSSELRITPHQPRAGAALTLKYRATARLAGNPQLVVRARYKMAPGPDANVTTLGKLQRDRSGWYAGSITLPDSAVYAVLAIEDTSAKIVDDHGESWDVVVHGSDGRPLADGLLARADDARMRNTRIELEALRTLTRLYPLNASGWDRLLMLEAQHLGRAAADSHATIYTPRLQQIVRALDAQLHPHARALASAVFFAGRIKDSATEGRLEDRLIQLYPTDASAIQRLVFRLAAARQSDAQYLASLDSLYRANGAAPQLLFDGFNTAVRMRDAKQIRLWVGRAGPNAIGYVSASDAYLDHPELREEGFGLMRREIRSLEDDRYWPRPLTMTVPEDERRRAAAASSRRARLAEALLLQNDTAAALAELTQASASGWNAARFRTLADLLYAGGDLDHARRWYAKVMADPGISSSTADTLRTRMHGNVEDLMAIARAEMREYFNNISLSRWPMREQATVVDVSGRRIEVRFAGTTPMLIAFWSRYCPPSVMQLRQLNAIAANAARKGVRVVIVTDEDPDASVEQAAHDNGLELATVFDVERHMRVAFDNTGTPRYIVLDRAGKIRFSDYSLEQLASKIAAVSL